jgi:hypothetical protein
VLELRADTISGPDFYVVAAHLFLPRTINPIITRHAITNMEKIDDSPYSPARLARNLSYKSKFIVTTGAWF